MDAMNEQAAAPAVAESEALTPRATLSSVIEQCEHALTDRLAKRCATRDSLKKLEKRCRDLLARADDREWAEEFGKVVITANAVFDQLIAEVEPAGNA